MDRRLLVPVLALPLAISSGCEESEMPKTTFTVRDSAGILISTSTAALWDTDASRLWSIGSEPLVDLAESGSGPSHEFYRVADATILSDGRIIVADAGSSQIRAFSRTGTALSQVGREGEGPGEYHQIMKVVRLGNDTVGVFSWPTKMTLLAPDLSLVTTLRLGDRANWPYALEGGQFIDLEVFASVIEYEGASQLIRAPASIVRRTREGAVEDTIWRGPGFEEFMFSSGDRRGSARPLFGKVVAMSVYGSSVLVGTSEAMEYQVLDSSGRPLRIVRVPGYDLALDPPTVEAEKASLLGPDPSAFRKELVAQLPVPDSRPAYSDFLVDAEGFLWAGETQSLRNYFEPRNWEVFSPDGQWMGSIQTPEKFKPFEIGVDWLLGVWRDEFDVEHVRMYPLDRGG